MSFISFIFYSTGPLHIPAKRPGFDADPSVIRHPHPWSSYESAAAGYDTQYHSQYILDRDRKPLYYGYPDPQFSQVGFNHLIFLKFSFDFECMLVNDIQISHDKK